MTGLRWWYASFGGTVAVLAIINVVAWAPSEGQRIGAWAILAGLALAFVTLGRPALKTGRFAIPFSVLVVLACGAAVACSPNMAVIQAISFPLVWSILANTRVAVVFDVALALAVFFGFLISQGAEPDAIVQAGTIQAISLVGSLALGLWISRIADLSHERKRLLDELTQAQDQLAALHRDAGATGERERLAREIHDTIAQDLTGLVMLSQRAQREVGAGAPAAETLGLLEDSARSALAETRALVASGAPVDLATGGIRHALDRLALRFGRETGLAIGVEVVPLPPLERDTEVVLLRIAQEGLANIRKHAATAGSVVVTLDLIDGRPTLAVRDDGGGFDPAAPTGGFGLGGMRDRLALVGGSLDVASSPAGTTLTATLPASHAPAGVRP